MAEHGAIEYATAAGNDYPTHENTYVSFVGFTFVGIVLVVNILLGLAVGGVMGHWLACAAIIVIAVIASIPGLVSGSRTSSYVSFAVCFLIFAFYGLAGGGAG
jgi:uncharacterized protein (DUF983 family)